MVESEPYSGRGVVRRSRITCIAFEHSCLIVRLRSEYGCVSSYLRSGAQRRYSGHSVVFRCQEHVLEDSRCERHDRVERSKGSDTSSRLR
jgi:hypothetical protein